MTTTEKDIERLKTIADEGKVSSYDAHAYGLTKHEWKMLGFTWTGLSGPGVEGVYGIWPHGRDSRQDLDAVVAPVESRRELLAAMKALFDNCVMVHKCWGPDSNVQEADAAVRQARAAIERAEGGEG